MSIKDVSEIGRLGDRERYSITSIWHLRNRPL